MRTTFSEFSRDVQPIWRAAGGHHTPAQADGRNFPSHFPNSLVQPDESKDNSFYLLEKADDLCGFASGALISCPEGDRLVQDLKIGDLVKTMDHGPKPIKWIGMNPLEPIGDFAPIRFSTGAFGAYQTLDVGPHQRMHLAMPVMNMLFGFSDGLAAARYLVDGASVAPIKSGEADYFQLLFDEHEIIWANGVATESLFVEETEADVAAADRADGLDQHFPGLANKLPRQNQMARPLLEGFEARLAMSYSKSPSDMAIPH